VARALVYVVAAAGEGGGPFRPEVWTYFAQAYRDLAVCYEELDKTDLAMNLRDLADRYFRAGNFPGGDDPPPAAALAMPIPRPPLFTIAIGVRLRP